MSNNSISTELESLQFELFTIYTYSQTKNIIESIKYSNLKQYENQKLIEEEKIIDIFLDFMELNHDQPEEILEIKLNFKKKNTNSITSSSSSSSLSSSSSSSSPSSSSSSYGGLIGGLVGGFVMICVGIVIFYVICCTRVVKVDQNGKEIKY